MAGLDGIFHQVANEHGHPPVGDEKRRASRVPASNTGNSGGPLLNLRGEVVAINAAVSGQGQGIGFAIPVNIAKNLLSQLRTGAPIARSYLGVLLAPVTPGVAQNLGLSRMAGALIAEVVPDSPADHAGLHAGDVVVRFDGKPVDRLEDLRLMAASAGIGREVAVDFVSTRGPRSVKVSLGKRPSR